MTEGIAAIISDVMSAASNCALYSREHPSVLHFLGRAVTAMEGLFEDGALSLAVLGDVLVVNGRKVSARTLHMGNFMKKLRRKGIEKIVIREGFTPMEFRGFISDLVAPGSDPRSSEHLSVGALQVKLGNAGTDPSAAIREGMEKVKEIHHGVSRYGKLDAAGLEEVVTGFLSTLREEANILRLLCPVKAHDTYTYAHTTNVTVLCIFQAEALGLKGETLHEVGLAGLLHDIGKMFIPGDILDKPSRLDAAEWEIIKKHPLYGAMYLSGVDSPSRLAVIAAFEHHMKHDGTGYPEPASRGRGQHLASQLVAISDFFDALRTERPYRKALETPVIAGIMEESRGRDFHPALVDNFLRALRGIGAL